MLSTCVLDAALEQEKDKHEHIWLEGIRWIREHIRTSLAFDCTLIFFFFFKWKKWPVSIEVYKIFFHEWMDFFFF